MTDVLEDAVQPAVMHRFDGCSNLLLQALLEQGSGEERIAELEAQIEDLMAEAETQAEESLAKDEEIDGLEAQLAAAKQALAGAHQACSLAPVKSGTCIQILYEVCPLGWMPGCLDALTWSECSTR